MDERWELGTILTNRPTGGGILAVGAFVLVMSGSVMLLVVGVAFVVLGFIGLRLQRRWRRRASFSRGAVRGANRRSFSERRDLLVSRAFSGDPLLNDRRSGGDRRLGTDRRSAEEGGRITASRPIASLFR